MNGIKVTIINKIWQKSIEDVYLVPYSPYATLARVKSIFREKECQPMQNSIWIIGYKIRVIEVVKSLLKEGTLHISIGSPAISVRP